MRSPLDRRAGRLDGPLRAAALAVSLLLHSAAATWALSGRPEAPGTEHWVEMAIIETPPPEPEPPPPEPEPPPPEPARREPPPTPEPVPFEQTAAEPPPEEAPPPEPRRPVRLVQGLSATSFARGSGTGLTVRAGTTTGVAAGPETMDIDEATGFEALPYSAVTTRPRLRWKPAIEVPEEAIEAGIEGTWDVTIDIGAGGRVERVHIPQRIGHGIDQACRAAWMASRWRPARSKGRPVPVTGVPRRCTLRAID